MKLSDCESFITEESRVSAEPAILAAAALMDDAVPVLEELSYPDLQSIAAGLVLALSGDENQNLKEKLFFELDLQVTEGYAGNPGPLRVDLVIVWKRLKIAKCFLQLHPSVV